ncbi:MAG: catalase [Clostridia bacterium]|nr:catalase [Clostridia bacterium]
MKFFKHLATVARHRRLVRKLCFKCGLYLQGLLHDISKFSLAEFNAGVKYYQGYRSPQAKEREELGYSAAWLHHKGRNKHHFEYWTDFADGERVFVEMPARYLAEMICDRVAASKVYLKDKYTDESPLQYFLNKTDRAGMNEKTAEKLEYFLTMLKDEGEKYTFKQLKKYVKENPRK